MTLEDMCRQFVEAVARHGRPVTAQEIAEELYGGEHAI
jgi:hypothetical protein